MYWYNGNLINNHTLELNINDPSLLYGATVFTTLRVYQKSLNHPLTNWQKHRDRLTNSLTSFDWPSPNWLHIYQGAEILSQSFPVLRITILSEGRELILPRKLPEDLAEKQQLGIIAWLADNSYNRVLPEHKTGNYLGAYLALQQGQKLGAKEAILTDENQNWLETSTGNLWGYKQGKYFTPPLSGILPGISRQVLMNWLKSQNQIVEEVIWDEKLVKELEAIAYSNSVVEIIPIHTVITRQNPLIYNVNHPSLEILKKCYLS